MLPLPTIERTVHDGVALLGDPRSPGGVTFAFTERGGGVSRPPFDSLNLGLNVGDDPEAVAENRARVLEALGCGRDLDRLVSPTQVHGDHVVVLDQPGHAALRSAQAEAQAGADGVVCSVVGVPVLLCYADCCPVVLCCQGAFAVVHSGWRGTEAEIASRALGILCDVTGCAPGEVDCYLGPHIAGVDYAVSDELLGRFRQRFGNIVTASPGHLSLASVIRSSLIRAGADPCRILNTGLSTPRNLDRFFSHRAEQGNTGRHGAVAWLPGR